jgi:hypothetical protein
MSSDWQPPRFPLFGIALIPPPAHRGADLPESGSDLAPAVANDAVDAARPEGPPESSAWKAVAVASAVPLAVVAVAETDPDLWPERWLHPEEKRLIRSLAPRARRLSLALLTAARRALVQALGLPAPAAASIDLSPLLNGVQSLRLGDWTLQRVPAPQGCQVAAAAPGSGWSYTLLPPEAAPPG